MSVVESAVRIEPEIYAWHDAQWGTLARDLARLPHALLFHGQEGLGKNAFALRLTQFLLCLERTENGRACGSCRSCTLFRAGNHPDLLCVGPPEDSRNILVDQIRGVIEFLSYKAHTSSHKVVIVSPAEAMNVNAANSLLKILEEPPPGSLLILVATHLSRLAATVRSRCTRITFSVPAPGQGMEWLRPRVPQGFDPAALLAQAGGAPLRALGLAGEDRPRLEGELLANLKRLAQGADDPVAVAERWKAFGTEECLEWLHRFVVDLIRCDAGKVASTNGERVGKDSKLFSITIIDLFDFLDKVSISRRQLRTGVDELLALEDLLIRWSDMSASTGKN